MVTINVNGSVNSLVVNVNRDGAVIEANGDEVWSAGPSYPPYLTFSSTARFSIETDELTAFWDGTIEYSTDANNWSTWDGTKVYSAATNGTHYLYLRGTGNTYISATSSSSVNAWGISGTAPVSCDGDIMTLLDYTDPENATMADYCFAYMFSSSNSLVKPPTLTATTLSTGCYRSMFQNSVLAELPKITASEFPSLCCSRMVSGCSFICLSETQTGEYQTPYTLPADGTATAASNAFNYMFQNTGGTFTGNPTVNTTYYTSNLVV